MTDKNAGAAADAPTPECEDWVLRYGHRRHWTNFARRLERERNRAYYLQAEQRDRAMNAERERDAARAKVDAIYDHLAEESDISPSRVRDSIESCLAGKPDAAKPRLTDADIDDAGLSKLEWRKRAEKAEAALAELQKRLADADDLLNHAALIEKVAKGYCLACNDIGTKHICAALKAALTQFAARQPAELQKRLDDAGEGLPPEAKRELVDEVLTVEAIDYDALRAAAESIIASLKVTVEMLEAGIAADAEVIAEKDAEIARLRGRCESLSNLLDNFIQVEAARKGRG